MKVEVGSWGDIMNNRVVIFGAGKMGARALVELREKGRCVCAFIDNSAEKYFGEYKGLPVVDIDTYCKQYSGVEICIACKSSYAMEIKQQLDEAGLGPYFIYNSDMGYNWKRLISYSMPGQLEDVILYHILHDIDNIFYIDVGCNDPFDSSVTKLLYDTKNAHGINIDPHRALMEVVQNERPRDINLCVGVGAAPGKEEFFYQGGLSTFVKENAKGSLRSEEIEIVTLADICCSHVPKEQQIHILKIDVEGFERQVIEGADFVNYRPWVLCIESTLPNTSIPSHEDWEPLLLKGGYEYIMMQGVNRYYLAKEHMELKERFKPLDWLTAKYKVYTVNCELVI